MFPECGESAMKVQDFAYQVCVRTMELLEEVHHYKISDAHRKEVTSKILQEIDSIIKKASAAEKNRKK